MSATQFFSELFGRWARHQRGPISGSSETPQISRQYCTEMFQGCPQLRPQQPTKKFLVEVLEYFIAKHVVRDPQHREFVQRLRVPAFISWILLVSISSIGAKLRARLKPLDTIALWCLNEQTVACITPRVVLQKLQRSTTGDLCEGGERIRPPTGGAANFLNQPLCVHFLSNCKPFI